MANPKKDRRTRHDIPRNGWSKDKRFFNGKPMEHWQKEADRLVIEQLIRAANVDNRSIIGALASQRILQLAAAENPELFTEVSAEIARLKAAIPTMLAEILGWA